MKIWIGLNTYPYLSAGINSVMKIDEVLVEDVEVIRQKLLVENTSGVSADSLLQVVQAHQENQLSAPMDVDDVIAKLIQGTPAWKL